MDVSLVENWYTVSIKDVLSEKVRREEIKGEEDGGKRRKLIRYKQSAGQVLRYYGGDVTTALVNLYPVLKRSKFPSMNYHLYLNYIFITN